MKLEQVISTFEEIEQTNSRNEMAELLGKLFKTIDNADDLDKVVKLCQGQIVSNLSQQDKLGVAEASVINALTLVSGYDKERIKNLTAKKGDVGSAAEELLAKKKQVALFSEAKKLEVKNLFTIIGTLAEIEGNDKIRYLQKIITELTPTQAKYIIRAIIGVLRLGFSTQTIIDGLAIGLTGDKTNRLAIEKAYNFNPDLSVVACQILKDGVVSIETPMIQYDTPIKPMLASRLKVEEILPKMGGRCFAEWKLDGVRVQIHLNSRKIKNTGNPKLDYEYNIKLYSRNLADVTDQFPEIKQYVIDNVDAYNCVLDGEIVPRPKDGKMIPFQVVMQRKRKHNIAEAVKEIPIVVFVFDIIKLGDKDYTSTPYRLRKEILKDLILDNDDIKFVNAQQINSPSQLVQYFEEAQKLGMEGIICKSVDGLYEAGKRGNTWVKLKSLEGARLGDTIDVVVIGGYHGRGRRAESGGAFLCAILDKENDRLIAFTKLGTGFTDEVLNDLTAKVRDHVVPMPHPRVFSYVQPDVWFEPFLVIEIMADEIQFREGKVYSPRFPVFKAVREDKTVDDITTLKEITAMYKRQHNV